MERLNNILQPHIKASKIRLSYVDELFPDLKNNGYIVLHRNIPAEQYLLDHEKNNKSFNECSRHDVSGSPLKYSFSNTEFDDTVVISRQNWRKEEEFYLPLSKMEACKALNACLEHVGTDTVPLLALCDGKDPKRSRCIGAVVSQDWFTTLEAVSVDMISLDAVRNECYKIVQEHLKRPFIQKHNIKKSIFSIIDLFGMRQETINWESTNNDFEGSISVETHSNGLDSRLSKNTLIVQVNAGWKNSPLKELRDQLFLLIHYLSIIDECRKDDNLHSEIKLASLQSEKHEVIIEKLNLLLNGDFNFQKADDIKRDNQIDKENTDIDAKLQKRVQNVSQRHDIDFTDLLWEILMKVSSYPQMISYVKTVLMNILEHKFIPQINHTNSTRFVKCINHQETISHLLMGSVPLELVVDMGFEKLIRDYLYILRGARFVDLHDIRQKLKNMPSGIFNTENYKNKLNTLAQIHICLECMLLIEAHLKCSFENLQSLFAYAYKEFVSEQSPLQHHTDGWKRIFTFTIPLSNALADELNYKINPTVWRASVSSQSAASILMNTTYYNKIPIFPTNIYSTDKTNIDVDTQEESVQVFNVMSSSSKYKKL